MRHDEAEDMGFGMRKERSEPVMVNTSPPATQRDRWMYEQGLLAERDPRTHADIAWELAEKVRRDLDRQSCPDAFMRIAVESIVKHFTTPPAAQRQWVGLTDEESVEIMRQVPHLTIGGLLAVEAKLKEKNT